MSKRLAFQVNWTLEFGSCVVAFLETKYSTIVAAVLKKSAALSLQEGI